MSLRMNDTTPDFVAENDTAHHSLSRVDRRRLDRPFFPPERLHLRVHPPSWAAWPFCRTSSPSEAPR